MITGLSGAGKTVALRALEDAGFFAIDNLPLPLLGEVIKLSRRSRRFEKLALGIDIREKELLEDLNNILTPAKADANIEILFLEAEKGVLSRRFKETRRPHPLSTKDNTEIESLIDREMSLLEPLRGHANRIVDTSSYTPHQLRSLMMETYAHTQGERTTVTLLSFGYKYGIPPNIDLLLDIRFLPNPHFVTDLRPLTGLDEPVRDFIFQSPLTAEFLQKTADYLTYLIPHYIKEGKTHITIGIGCTGGQHRSPAIVEELGNVISERLKIGIRKVHREL